MAHKGRRGVPTAGEGSVDSRLQAVVFAARYGAVTIR